MNKFVLIAGAAALVFPVAAHAKDWKHSDKKADEQHYTYKKVDNSSTDGREYRIEVKSEDDFSTNPRHRTYTTIEGERLQIDGTSVYKITSDGQRFFAPNGSYQTQGNQVVVVEDGQFTRFELAPDVTLFDMDDNSVRTTRRRM